jgi:hypothetical protein
MTRHGVQAGAHRHADRGADLYETPAVATEALMQAENLPHRIWEPAAGRGAIVKVLRDRGHAVTTSDLIQRDFPLHFIGDFLAQTKAPAGVECILTNFPFAIIDKCIAHALDLCPCVIVLARLALLESTRRTEILEHRGLARVHVFRNRLMLHRDGWTGPRASSAMPFAWFAWKREHTGPATINRISAEREQPKPTAMPAARINRPAMKGMQHAQKISRHDLWHRHLGSRST